MPRTSSSKKAPGPQPGGLPAGQAERQWQRCLARYSADIVRQMTAARRKLRSRIPRGFELVYDNYNALAVGFSPTDRSSLAVVSLAAYPRWVTLFFLQGARLKDPDGLLQGEGRRVRSIRLEDPDTLDDVRVVRLIEQALGEHAAAFAAAPALSTLIKSISSRQRARRPDESGAISDRRKRPTTKG
jgi:hypothetical protein